MHHLPYLFELSPPYLAQAAFTLYGAGMRAVLAFLQQRLKREAER